MATIQSQLPTTYQNASSRPADVTQTMLDLFNILGKIDSTLPNNTLIETGLTAHAGGTQAAALALSPTVFVHQVNTVGTAADSVRLPVSVAGQTHIVINNAAANSMQVFGAGTDTINNIATATGVAQAAGIAGLYYCPAPGLWFRMVGG
jgi:hypothetical protein